MKRLSFVSVGLLLALLAMVLIWWQIGLPRATASTNCDTPASLTGATTGSASAPRCYRYNVPSGSNFLRIKLEPIEGSSLDLYHNEGEVSFLSNWDKVNADKINRKVTYAFLEPQPGTHTIAVAGGGSGSFSLSASAIGAASAASSQPTTSCSGDACRTTYALILSPQAIELGPEFGDRVIFPLEVTGPGRVEVRATWTGSASNLALILNGPDRPELPNPVAYYERSDGASPLSLAYNITADDFRRGRKWRVSVVNFSGGFASGNVQVSFPGETAQDDVERSARLEDFAGFWQNVDAQTRGITRIEIERAGNSLRVHSWGACTPTECDHGTTTVAFQGNPVVVSRDFSFKREVLTLTLLRSGELRALSDNIFTDGSQRDYVSEYRFRRSSTEPGAETYKTIDFAAWPNGIRVTETRVLAGDEFVQRGIKVAAAPIGSYCADAKAAVRVDSYASVPYLSTARPGQLNACNGVPLRIDFTTPVKAVTVSFVGAADVYTLTAYDSQSRQLGAATQTGQIGRASVVTYRSAAANISRIVFGRQAAITVVTALTVEAPQVADDIRNFRVTRASDAEIEFTVDYSYNSDHGDNVFLGAYTLRSGQQLASFGYGPARASRGSGSATVRLVYHPGGAPGSVTSDQVQVTMYVGGGSVFYSKIFDYRKTWSAAAQGLSAPRQSSPPDGSVFDRFPRTTMLQWWAVPGAASYTVEIDCYHCCQTDRWCTDVGRTWKVVSNVTQTAYTFDFVGAQPGRWRVWAVDAAGGEGSKSDWWEFRYTR